MAADPEAQRKGKRKSGGEGEAINNQRLRNIHREINKSNGERKFSLVEKDRKDTRAQYRPPYLDQFQKNCQDEREKLNMNGLDSKRAEEGSYQRVEDLCRLPGSETKRCCVGQKQKKKPTVERDFLPRCRIGIKRELSYVSIFRL